MSIDGLKLIAQEVQHQSEEWGFEHDVMTHGGGLLLEAASVVLSGQDLDDDETTLPWANRLYRKHRDNPIRRAMIAGALCSSAIDVLTLEAGQRHRAADAEETNG